MTLGITYVRGRVDGATTESGCVREAGQFTSPLLSCPVRTSTTDRVQIPIASLTAATGAVVIFWRPDNANGALAAATTAIFELYIDANNYLLVTYNRAAARFEFVRKGAGVTSTALVQADTFASGDAKVIYVGWSSANMYLGVGGGTFATQADANVVVGTLPTTFDVGYAPSNVVARIDANYGAVAILSAHTTQANWTSLAALAALRPPCYGEYVGSVMCGLWYGCHGIVWTTPSTAGVLDFMNNRPSLVTKSFLGAGIGPVLHRAVSTPLRDGAAYVDTRMQPRTLMIALVTSGVSIDSFYAFRRSLAQILNPRLGLGIIMFAPSIAVYEIDSLVQQGMDFSQVAAAIHDLSVVQFYCPNGTWRVAGRSEDAESIPLAGWSLPWSLPWPFSPSSVTFTLTNSGDLDVYPKYIVTAGASGCTNPSITNNTTGLTFKLSGLTLAAGEVVTIDMDARTATKQDGTNVLGYRSATSVMFPLTPGANSVTAAVDAGNATTKTRWAPQLVGV